MARRGGVVEELGGAILGPRLQDRVQHRREAAQHVGLAGQRGGLHPVGGHADLGQRVLERGDQAEDADRTGDGAGFGEDDVGGRRHPVTARRCLLYTSGAGDGPPCFCTGGGPFTQEKQNRSIRHRAHCVHPARECQPDGITRRPRAVAGDRGGA